MARILVIDDDYRMRTLVKSILRRNRHEVFDEAEGKYGIEQATISVPDLILLDIGLPDMDGLEACRCLKANPKTRHIPIIILTGHGEADDVAKAYQSGGNDYIVKPFATAILLAKVAKHLGPNVVILGKPDTTAIPAAALAAAPEPVPAGAKPSTGKTPPTAGTKPSAGQKQPPAGAKPVAPAAETAADAPAAGNGGEAKQSLRSQVAERQKKRGGVL